MIVLVDGENVRRSTWPNVGRDELARLCAAWAGREGVQVELVWEGAASADDAIAARAEELARAGEPYGLVTSDRELRERAGAHADRVTGGGSFLRALRGV